MMADRYLIDDHKTADLLPERIARSNKGTYGHSLIMAGSFGMCGAAVLSAEAAYRSGCGLVSVLSPACNRLIIQTALPEALFLCMPENADPLFADGRKLKYHAAAAGPGLGREQSVKRHLLRLIDELSCPIVLDADALNLLSEDLAFLPVKERTEGRNFIITPHPGEMARLTGVCVKDILADPVSVAEEFASRYGLIVVLKDLHTVVTDGRRTYINDTGCDGMATGGSGDVLTGMITSLLAQGCPAFTAAALSVRIHGTAGEIAAEKFGCRGMIASDIVRCIPDAFLFYQLKQGEKSS